MENNKFLKQ